MTGRQILHTWVIAFLGCTVIGAVVYSLMPPEQSNTFQQIIAWFIWPGVGLYVLWNGSLLFGGGFGDAGNAAIMILGSAATWSIPITFAVQGALWLRRRRRQH